MAAAALMPSEDMLEIAERMLAISPADATEIVWIEARRGQAGGGAAGSAGPAGFAGSAGSAGSGDPGGHRRPRRELSREPHDPALRRDRSVLVRIRESGRTGMHCTGGDELSDLEIAVREALAQARLAPASSAEPMATPLASSTAAELAPQAAARADRLPEHAEPLPAELFDPELAEMTPEAGRAAAERLARGEDRGARADERVRLGWAAGTVVIANSAGLRRAARVTAVTLEAACGSGPRGGRAAAVARRLDALDAPLVMERARRETPESPELMAGVMEGPVALVLAQEGAAVLLEMLNRLALSAKSFLDGTSLLRDNLGDQVFHSAINLRDDASDPRGLPFAFDLAGWSKRPVDLISRGVVLTPAVDSRLAGEIGRPATPHRIAADDSLASNLFLLPGERPDEELLREAAGGVWAGALDPIECFDPRALRFRAVLRGVRRIDRAGSGALGAALPDLVWEDSVPSALSRVLGVGREPVAVACGDPLFGALTTPILALERAEHLRPRT
ncbi:MAG TPA: metallopeptidase TldD-related protein [Thermoanaerobaculia bacterium]|nr:metallopeptidase TldD-related protein [Thermoanaerobaculia bacterium]